MNTTAAMDELLAAGEDMIVWLEDLATRPAAVRDAELAPLLNACARWRLARGALLQADEEEG